MIDNLSTQIYVNYLAYLRENKLVEICFEFLTSSYVKGFNEPNQDLISIKIEELYYLNKPFIERVFLKITEYLLRDMHIIEKFGTLENHLTYSYAFIGVCLMNEPFMNNFLTTKK
jgi:hypothetical protein